MGHATMGRSWGMFRTSFTPSSLSVPSRSASTPFNTMAQSDGSAAPMGCWASSRKCCVISAARRTSPCNIISARARSGSSGLPCSRSASAPIAARRLFNAFSTFAEPSSSTTCCTSGGEKRAAGTGVVRSGVAAARCPARCRPISTPMNAPTRPPNPNATHSSIGHQSSVGRAGAPLHRGGVMHARAAPVDPPARRF